MDHGLFFSSLRVTMSNPYIFDPVLGTIDELPLQSFDVCGLVLLATGACPISTDISNRTGHQIQWTATIIDRQTRQPVVPARSGLISGAPGQAIPGRATTFFPPTTLTTKLFPSYILDIKVVDLQDPAGWSTERQAYVTITNPLGVLTGH
jgi:hypothetical protein